MNRKYSLCLSFSLNGVLKKTILLLLTSFQVLSLDYGVKYEDLDSIAVDRTCQNTFRATSQLEYDVECISEYCLRGRKRKTEVDYSYNPHVPIDLWVKLKPYFLPYDHPIRKKLDRIFHEKRVTLSPEAFKEAGFSITRPKRPFNAVVTGHKNLQGFLLKVYLDSQFDIPEWEKWLIRIKGAEVIQACIDEHGFTELVVPKKWIYPLPAEPSPPLEEQYNRKNFILVVEDMKILDQKANKKAYKQKMTTNLLTALYIVLTKCQLSDSTYIGNSPFTCCDQIAFVDTELFLTGRMPNYGRMKNKLSLPMQEYFDKLISEGL